MSNPGKGGRGKVAPYVTVHYRIPRAIKPTVENLANAYRLFAGAAKWKECNKLIEKVNAVISSDEHQGRSQSDVYDESITKLQSELTIANQEIEKLKLQRDEVNRILLPALEMKANAGGKIKEAIRLALSKLAE